MSEYKKLMDLMFTLVVTGTTSRRTAYRFLWSIINCGESSPDVSAGGLCLNQNATDGIILSFKSSDMNHGITDFETDTYFSARKTSGDKGGVRIRNLY